MAAWLDKHKRGDGAVPEGCTLAMAVLSCYQALMLCSGLVDFNDMLSLARDLLQGHPAVLEEVQRTYTHLLVDEYQDSNPVQVRLDAVTFAVGVLYTCSEHMKHGTSLVQNSLCCCRRLIT